MALISPAQVTDGSTGVNAASINSPINTIANDYNGGITDANISATAAIGAGKLAGGTTGMFGAWVTWTPTLTNLSGGTSTYFKYIQIGKMVHCRFKYTLAGAGVGTQPGFSLPVTANADYAGTDTGETLDGTVSIIDSGNTYWTGKIMQLTTTTIRIRALDGNGNLVSVTATNPFTFGNADFIQGHFSYEAA